jgi:hypothetical protein
LNPFIRELYAFRNQNGGIVPIIGFDGWIKMVQKQPTFQGEELTDGWDERLDKTGSQRGFFYECKMYRSDRKVPTIIREYHNENWRNTDPWNLMPNRMTRMRAYIQCARVCFGFGGVFDPDEGEKIAVGQGIDLLPLSKKPATEEPQPKQAAHASSAPALITHEQLEHVNERLAMSGVPDNLVLAKFEVGSFEEIPFERVADVVQFINDQAPRGPEE